ncbi:IS5 family transposase [Streptomyces sp. HP-A2021]|uniref:IS5 family transposase n=1 Tax=Streptomyces sp. HP-A2021 TaxID=2927875 RepID=UPI001FAF6382|nr:IS5 family transposase [Streptomyces sp. HP-A2021]UOB08014.1 IS5 family transposase [Streptomyces sp. HP-A2021]
MTAALVERMAPEDLWTLFQRVVPPAPVCPQGGGHRRRGDREVLAAIIFVATSGCTWNQLPPGFGLSGVTAFRRFTEWTEARVWAKLHRLVLDELGARGELDWSRCAIDSVSVRALKGAADGTESDRPRQEGIENPPHRRPPGLPLSVGISAANLHDSQALIPLVRGIPPIRSRRGPRRRRPGKLHGDKGYDYRHLRRWLASRGIRHRVARKGIESSRRLGQHRWIVERTVSWLSGCRRLHRRYERKPEHFLAFTAIAATLICHRRLTK